MTTLTRGRRGWWILALSLAIYGGISIAMHQPFHAGGLQLRYFDLHVYRFGALRLTHGVPLYGSPMLDGLGFTYPPFAALLMAPLAWAPLSLDDLALTAVNVLLLVWIMRRASMFAFRSGMARPACSFSDAAALAAAAVWLEPISVTLGYGQINLAIAALVVFDLSRRDDAASKGMAIGVAAAIKLTPLLFIAYLLLSRRRRAALLAGATFAGLIALSFLMVPHDASAYWSGLFLDTSRIGNGADPLNQSALGAIERLTSTHQPSVGAEFLIAGLALSGVLLAARAARRGDEAAGFSLAALATLLASPISWNHHWTLAVPALLLLGQRAHERRSLALGGATVMLALAGYAYLPEIAEGNFRSQHGLASLLLTDPYPLIALLALSACAARLLPARLSRRGRRDRSPATAVPRLIDAKMA